LDHARCAISVLYNDATGFPAKKDDYSVGKGPTGVAIDDLDGDGDLDAVVANYESDDVSVTSTVHADDQR
jgi:hypothetical protein